MKKPEPQHVLQLREIIQIVPTHKWGGCLAVVDEVKGFGCQAYVTGPIPVDPVLKAHTGKFYIRLAWEEFERVGAKVIFGPAT